MALNDFIQKTLGFQLLQPPKAYVESYNGSTWTEIADINTGREYLGGTPAGVSTYSLAF